MPILGGCELSLATWSEAARPVRFSVVLATYNRAKLVPRAIKSVLAQSGVPFELIVVDDGSTDDTPSVLKEFDDPRLTVVNRINGGLSAARNSGIAKATGDWITFLDDDDMGLAQWLEGLAELIDDRAGIVCCGAEYRTAEGEHVSTVLPEPMGPLYEHQVGTRIAGTFAVRADLLRAVGGYEERMTCAHQSELLMRLIPAMLARGLTMRSTERILLNCESRAATERPMSSPAALYQGTRVLLDKHGEMISRHPANLAVYSGIVGVSAARLERWPEARRAFLNAARAQPLNVRNWVRVAAAFSPTMGRWMWRVAGYRKGG